MLSGAFSPRRAPPFLPSRAGADARRRREVRARVWAASGAAQLRAEVQLESEGAGWRRSPWGFGKVIQLAGNSLEQNMCACPGHLPALALTTRLEPEKQRSSGGKCCLGRPGQSQLSIHTLHFPSLGLWSLIFLMFSRDFVFPGT